MTPYANYWHAQKYLARVLKIVIIKFDQNLDLPDEFSDRENCLKPIQVTSKLIVHELNLSCNKITAVIYHVNLINVLQVETFSKPIKDV